MDFLDEVKKCLNQDLQDGRISKTKRGNVFTAS